jgi:CBS domain-containing protein
MNAADVMLRKVITVNPDTTLIEVAKILDFNNISGVPVVNDYGIVEGLVTREDLFSPDRKFYLPMYAWIIKDTDFVMGAKSGLPYEAERIVRVTAKEIMNKQVFFAEADMDLEKVAAKVATLGQNPIPVVNHANKLVGILTKGDLLRHFAGVEQKKQNPKRPNYIENEFKYVANNMSSHYAFIAKSRANVWLITATVLFIIGFLAGMVYVVNPNIFRF